MCPLKGNKVREGGYAINAITPLLSLKNTNYINGMVQDSEECMRWAWI